jgi:hypothetical protein
MKYGILITYQLCIWLEVYKTHTQCYSFLLRNPTTELVVSTAYTLIKPDLSRIKYISFSWETGPFGGLRSKRKHTMTMNLW